mgnify:CR=1 FL=1
MSNPREVSYHNPPEYRSGSFPDLITSPEQGLGYCCLWGFFRKFKYTERVAIRLGVDRTTVQKWRRRFKAGEFTCLACPKRCLKKNGVV